MNLGFFQMMFILSALILAGLSLLCLLVLLVLLWSKEIPLKWKYLPQVVVLTLIFTLTVFVSPLIFTMLWMTRQLKFKRKTTLFS